MVETSWFWKAFRGEEAIGGGQTAAKKAKVIAHVPNPVRINKEMICIQDEWFHRCTKGIGKAVIQEYCNLDSRSSFAI